MDEKYLKKAWAETLVPKDEIEEIKKTLGAPKEQQESDFDRWTKEQLTERLMFYLKDKIQFKTEDNGNTVKFTASLFWYDLQQELKDNEETKGNQNT